jgi:hypothetical protein
MVVQTCGHTELHKVTDVTARRVYYQCRYCVQRLELETYKLHRPPWVLRKISIAIRAAVHFLSRS